MEERLIITVDGPAGTGKSTVSKLIARKISYIYLDTGALYRAMACKALENGISTDNEKLLSDLCGNVKISFRIEDNEMRVMIDGDEITEKIRTEEVGFVASKISASPVVRETLLPIQREAGKSKGIVAEGRDMGTVVFPYADIKFYLDATVPERAKRRYLQLSEQGVGADFEEVKHGLEVRDGQDSRRNIAPLRPSKDAVIIDTTGIEVDDVVKLMMEFIDGFIRKNKENS